MSTTPLGRLQRLLRNTRASRTKTHAPGDDDPRPERPPQLLPLGDAVMGGAAPQAPADEAASPRPAPSGSARRLGLRRERLVRGGALARDAGAHGVGARRGGVVEL